MDRQERARAIFELQRKIALNVCFCLYSMEEFCVLNYILLTLKESPFVRIEDIQRIFADAETIMAGLEASKIIIKSPDKKSVKVNDSLFVVLGSLCKGIERKLELKKKEIEESKDKVKCKNCGKKRELYEIGFIQCQCLSSQVEKINVDKSPELEEIGLMQQLINNISEWSGERSALIREQQLKGDDSSSTLVQEREVTDIKQVMVKLNKDLENLRKKTANYTPIWNLETLKKSAYFMKQAERKYAPRRQFQRAEELESIRKKRKSN